MYICYKYFTHFNIYMALELISSHTLLCRFQLAMKQLQFCEGEAVGASKVD